MRKPDATTSAPVQDVHPVYIALPTSGADDIDLLELWSILWQRKWLIAGITSVFTAIGIVYAFLATPIYRAEVVLAPTAAKQDGSGLSGLASLAGINLGTSTENVQALALLRSKKFAEEFIREKGLLPVLFPDHWDSENRRWREDVSPDGPPDIRDGVKYFVENVRFISEDSQTGLVTIAIEWTDPVTAAEWANELVLQINESVRQRDTAVAQRKLDYLNEQLARANLLELRQAISRVIEDQIGAVTLALAQPEYAFSVIDPAVVPKDRVRPKRTIIVILAAVVGGVMASLFVLLRFGIRRRT